MRCKDCCSPDGDAMPGKQMSIDAELRAGHIDHNEALRRRAALARESQLFGSMDGAMKFVIVPRLAIRTGARRLRFDMSTVHRPSANVG